MSRYLKSIILSFAFFSIYAQAEKLEIIVSKISEPHGTLFVTIYNNPDSWLGEEAYRDLRFPVSTQEDNTIVIEDIPAGTYAVSVFHDLNGNMDIDTNLIGIPKEPYGFSGKVGKFGPPKYDKASFVLESGTKPLQIELH